MKKILLFIFVFCLFIGNVNATKLVSLGDSIPNGYLLKNPDNSYDNKIAETLKLDFYEHSYIGMTSQDLLDDMQDEEIISEIKSADIVFLNIGANDLLDVADYLDLDGFNVNINYYVSTELEIDPDVLNDTVSNIDSIIKEQLEDRANEALENFEVNFPLIIARINELNPKAVIYVNNFYNPYFDLKLPIKSIDLSSISNYFDEKIKAFDKVYEDNSGYILMDIYNLLRDNRYLNLNIITGSFDPHPNIAGHNKIFKLYLDEMAYKVTYDDEDYYVLKGHKLDIKPKEKDGYTFSKWNYDINHIDKNITLKAIYKKKINYYLVGSIIAFCLLIIALFAKKGRK